MKLKYVIYDDCYPVIFGEYFKHTDVRTFKQATSAGFVSLKEVDTPESSQFCCARMLKAYCYGESFSLGVKSRGEDDARLIERMFNQ
jgi:hypothetical protein